MNKICLLVSFSVHPRRQRRLLQIMAPQNLRDARYRRHTTCDVKAGSNYAIHDSSSHLAPLPGSYTPKLATLWSAGSRTGRKTVKALLILELACQLEETPAFAFQSPAGTQSTRLFTLRVSRSSLYALGRRGRRFTATASPAEANIYFYPDYWHRFLLQTDSFCQRYGRLRPGKRTSAPLEDFSWPA